MVRAVLRNLVAAAALLTIYFASPVPQGTSISVWGILFFLAGIVGLAVVCVVLVQRVRFPLESGPDVRIEAFILLAYAVIVFFSFTYLWMSRDADQFDELSTHIDALYFTMATLATVGYGDVHAVGQAARAAATIQMAFDVVFLAATVKVLGPVIEQRRAARRSSEQQRAPRPGA